VLGVRSAARLHGFYAYRSTDAVDVVIPRARDSRTAIGRLVQNRWMPGEHVTIVDGFPVTTVARTFFDLCANPEPGLSYRHRYHEQRMKMVYNDALGRRGMTFTQEAAVLLVLARRGRTGTRLTRRILLHYGPKHQPTRSDAETLFLEVVRTHGLPDPERQGVIAGERGFIGTVDFVWRSRKLIVEIDSSWHDGPEDEERDLERDRQLEKAGYTVKRYRYGDLVAHPDRIARVLGAILDGRP
jgi:very-short-patch-repair endonuclease